MIIVPKRNWIDYSFILVIALSLINLSGLFIHPSESAYYFFCMGSAVLLLLAIAFSLAHGGIASVSITAIPIITLVMYVLLHGAFIEGLNSWHYYYISIGGFLLAAYEFIKRKKVNISIIESGILCLSVVEAVVCLLQYAGWIGTMNSFLPVSGTWVNPNVTAMFISMTFPAAFLRFLSGNRRFLYGFVLMLLFAGIMVLKCRSAYLGIFLSALVCLYFYYRTYRIKYKKTFLFALTLIIGLCIPVANYLHQLKKDSADGRLLIYRVATKMILHKPLSGYGVGLFEKHYNLAQAEYLEKGNTDSKAIEYAGHVNMAYNELLQHGVEAGMPGLLLFAGAFIFMLYRGYVTLLKSDAHKSYHLIISYAGIVAFFIMSIVNFTWQAIPVVGILAFYIAVLANSDSRLIFLKRRNLVTISLFFTAIILLSHLIITANASRQNKIALRYIKNHQVKNAIGLLIPLKNPLKQEESYWNSLSRAYFLTGSYREAISALQKAERYSSKPNIFHLKAQSYEKLGLSENALENWRIAARLEPNKMLPQYHMMNIYLNTGKLDYARQKALYLLAFKPKGISKKATLYKDEARHILEKLEVKGGNLYQTEAAIQ